jgi:hypothetical protein
MIANWGGGRGCMAETLRGVTGLGTGAAWHRGDGIRDADWAKELKMPEFGLLVDWG